MRPLDVAWDAAGQPTIELDGPPLSTNFAHHDIFELTTPAELWAVRAWGPIRTAESRWKQSSLIALHINQTSVTEIFTGDPLPALEPTDALIVPVSRQQHVLALAQFGYLTTDSGAHIPLIPTVIDALTLVGQLMPVVGEKALEPPAPPLSAALKLGVNPTDVVTQWRRLAPLRIHPKGIPAACRLHRKPKKK